MKDLTLRHQSGNLQGKIQITGSKSESNRMLLLQALFPQIALANLSNSDDTVAMKSGLESDNNLVDIGHAGTSMRFLTAYYSTLENQEKTLTGSPRMQERPIGILADALRQLGADISYLKNEGYPPLLIKGKRLTASEVHLSANISSQYITALMLIAPSLPDGLSLHLEGKDNFNPLYRNDTFSIASESALTLLSLGSTFRFSPKMTLLKLPTMLSRIGARPRTILVW